MTKISNIKEAVSRHRQARGKEKETAAKADRKENTFFLEGTRVWKKKDKKRGKKKIKQVAFV